MPERRIATVLMLDVVGSTHVAAQLGDARYRELSSRFNRLVRASLKRFGGREEDHAGDGFFTTFPQPDRAIRCAAALADEVRTLGIEIRSGIHTGQTEDQAGKTHGIAVVIGARVMSLAGAGEILVTSTTKELVTGSGFGFEDFSAHELKGVPGTWQVFAVTAVDEKERARPLPATGETVSSIQAEGAEPPPGVTLPISPHPIVAGQGGIWVLRFRGYLLNVDPLRREVRHRIRLEVGDDPTAAVSLAGGFDGVWASYGQGVIRVHPATAEQEHFYRLTRGGVVSGLPMDVAVGGGRVWLGRGDGLLVSLDPASRRDPVTVESTAPIDAIEFGHGAVWTLDVVGETLSEYDPDTMRRTSRVQVGGGDRVVAGDSAIWVLSRSLGTLTRIDPSTKEPTGVVQVGPSPSGLAAGVGVIWVGDKDGVIRRVDEDTGQVIEIPFGAEIRAIAFDEETDTLWIDVA